MRKSCRHVARLELCSYYTSPFSSNRISPSFKRGKAKKTEPPIYGKWLWFVCVLLVLLIAVPDKTPVRPPSLYIGTRPVGSIIITLSRTRSPINIVSKDLWLFM